MGPVRIRYLAPRTQIGLTHISIILYRYMQDSLPKRQSGVLRSYKSLITYGMWRIHILNLDVDVDNPPVCIKLYKYNVVGILSTYSKRTGFSIREQLETLWRIEWLGQAQINQSVWIVLNKHRKVCDNTPQLRAQRSVFMEVKNIESLTAIFYSNYQNLLIMIEIDIENNVRIIFNIDDKECGSRN